MGSLMHDAEHLKLVLRDSLERRGGKADEKAVQDVVDTHMLWPIHIDVRQKSSQCHKVIILQLK